ncbi:penicillin-binding protein 2 [soil metagenome]
MLRNLHRPFAGSLLVLGLLTLPLASHAEEEGGIAPSAYTRADARTMTFSVPAPRGQILDRTGAPFANSILAYHLGIRLPNLGNDPPNSEILRIARERVDKANALLGARFALEPSSILTHYTHRRWLPLRLSPILTEAQLEKCRPVADDTSSGLALEPVYRRSYPAGRAAAHIIGYVGRKTPPETGEIVEGELLFEDYEGRSGLEEIYDDKLTGTPGRINYVFDGDGQVLSKTVINPPVPGRDVVVTLDLAMQELAERILERDTKRGALVVLDAGRGDILALASWPTFDPNSFVPSISASAYAKLRDDPAAPLFPRAYASAYPPGSTFKPVVALAALERGTVTPYSEYYCPISLNIDGREFHNWNRKNPEGNLDVRGALARSCNTWFYQAGIDTGAANILYVSRLLGFGEPLQLPLSNPATGTLPEAPFFRQKTANLSIGQGEFTASPLQIAASLGAIANGRSLPQLRLVSQIQDYEHRILEYAPTKARGILPFSSAHIATVQDGMWQVVNTARGTAKAVQRARPAIAGKTGTSQWGQVGGKPRYLSLFGGFTFSSNPQLAFVAVYEGIPGETVAGARQAAPMISSFLDSLYSSPDTYAIEAPEDIPPPDTPAPQYADSEPPHGYPQGYPSDYPPGSRPVYVQPLPTGPATAGDDEGGVGGFFRRLFGN